jgi:hypothetical protein
MKSGIQPSWLMFESDEKLKKAVCTFASCSTPSFVADTIGQVKPRVCLYRSCDIGETRVRWPRSFDFVVACNTNREAASRHDLPRVNGRSVINLDHCRCFLKTRRQIQIIYWLHYAIRQVSASHCPTVCMYVTAQITSKICPFSPRQSKSDGACNVHLIYSINIYST